MPARKVSGFVRENADNFVRRLCIEKRAGVDEDMPPSMTKALNERSLSTTTLTFCFASPAARKTGWA